jgi:SAM-dependent methyltransferase
MRLTTKTDWQYKDFPDLRSIQDAWKRDEWIRIANKILPSSSVRYLELGCAPGTFTAALSKDKDWLITGIDFSDDSNKFISTLFCVQKTGRFFHADIFNFSMGEVFDIVASFGLVEHFRGSSFDQLMDIHDRYVAPGGYCVVVVPNFTGVPYFFHFVFDRPSLDNHNIDAMHPDTIAEFFRQRGYEIVFHKYVGILRLWGNSGFLNSRILAKTVAGLAVSLSKLASLMSLLGIHLRGRSWSPYLMVIARKIKPD